MANVNIRLGNKSSAWFSANPTLVLLSGQLVFLDDQSGQYKKGDGTTQLSALSFLGGGSVSGTTNRITVTGSTIDIASTYIGQNSITTLGTIGTGTWQGTSIGTGYTDAKIKGTVAVNQIGFGSGADTLAGSNDWTYNDSTKLAYLNGRMGIGIVAVTATLVSLKSTGNTSIIYVGQFYNSDNNLVTRLSSIYTGSITALTATGSAFAHSVGMYGFTTYGQNEIYNGANAYAIDSRAIIRFHTSTGSQFLVGEENATSWGVYANTASKWAFRVNANGTSHVNGFDATYGIAPLNVYAKTAAEGYNYSGSLGVNIVAVGSSCYPILAFSKNGTSNGYGSILWQDSAYDALTGSSIGNQAFFSCYNDSGKGLFELRVNNNIGTTAPTTVISALGNALTIGASTGSLGFFGTTPIAKPTTAFSAGTYAAVGGSSIQTDDTFAAPSGAVYTQPQINRIILTLLGL